MFRAILLFFLLLSSVSYAEDWSCPDPNDPCGGESLCNTSDTLFCEDWEDQGYEGWAWVEADHDCSTGTKPICEKTPGAMSTTYAQEFRIAENSDQAAWLDYGPWGSGHFAHENPIFLRYYVYFSANHKFYRDGWAKNLYMSAKVMPGDTSGWRALMIERCVIPDGYPSTFCDDAGARSYGRLAVDAERHPVYYQTEVGTWTDDHPCIIPRETWKLIELEVKCAKVSSSSCTGDDCGHVRIWIDGTLCTEYTELSGDPYDEKVGNAQPNPGGGDICWGNPAGAGDDAQGMNYGVNKIRLTPYHGGAVINHPESWVAYDQIVLSRSRVGSGVSDPNAAIPQGCEIRGQFH